jgi:transcriptional regulator of acetoin/glycerol metabolism
VFPPLTEQAIPVQLALNARTFYRSSCLLNFSLEVALNEKAWKRKGTMAHAKYKAVMKALVWSKWDMNLAARRLEISLATIYRLLEKYDVDPVEMSKTANKVN